MLTLENPLSGTRKRVFGWLLVAVFGSSLAVQAVPQREQQRQDRELALQVQRNLAQPQTRRISIATENGIVLLTGFVETLWAKEQAVALVKGIPQVRAVVEVIDTVPPVARSDQFIAQDVQEAIAQIKGARVEVVLVYDGKTTLRGEVESVAQQNRMREMVKQVPGVLALNDQTVPLRANASARAKPKQAKSDADIEEAVWDAYRCDPRVVNAKPKIAVTNGVVTLTGTVAGVLVKQALNETAANTIGVQRVNDFLQVSYRPPARTDRDLQAAIERTLQDQFGEAADQMVVSVLEQTVYLSGTVASAEAKSEVERAIAEMPGVEFIQDQLVVR